MLNTFCLNTRSLYNARMTSQHGKICQWSFAEHLLGEGCGGKDQSDPWSTPESPQVFADSLRWYVCQPDIPITMDSTVVELLLYLDSIHRNYAYRVIDASMVSLDLDRAATIATVLEAIGK